MVELSDLPREIIDVILSLLPLREAVRTSILSKNWRYKWTTVRDLVFEPDRCRDLRFSNPLCEVKRVNKLVTSINHVLTFHANPIWLFHVIDVPPISDIDRWLLHLSRSSVRDLRLLLKSRNYVVPPSLYSCERLVRLEPRGFSLKAAPLSFNGFPCLKSLYLYRITLTDDAFERLVSHCPLLEKLNMDECQGVHCLKIDAPNLQCVAFYGNDFQDIRFEGMHTKLSYFCSLFSWDKDDTTIVPTCLDQFFVNLPGIEELEIDVNFLKNSMAASFPPILLPTPFVRLHRLAIAIQLDDRREFCAAFYLFRSSPELGKLNIRDSGPSIDSSTFGGVSRWSDKMVTSNCTFRELRHVEVKYSRCRQEHLEFFEFVLLNSPVLELLYLLSPFSQTYCAQEMHRLDRAIRASPNARIIFSNSPSGAIF